MSAAVRRLPILEAKRLSKGLAPPAFERCTVSQLTVRDRGWQRIHVRHRWSAYELDGRRVLSKRSVRTWNCWGPWSEYR